MKLNLPEEPVLSDSHRLGSTVPGESEVEQIAERIERRRCERVPVTFKARVRFLKDCRSIAIANESESARISLKDLHAYRKEILKEAENHRGICNFWILKSIGIMADVDQLLAILDRAISVMEGSDIDENWFYYRDFAHDNTRIISRWPFMRNSLRKALCVLALFYVGTPILFCNVMQQSEICTANGSLGSGWMSALYFASTTISTVGYGDLVVSQDPRWRSFIGSIYMLLAMVVAVVAFSAAAESTLSPFQNMFQSAFKRFDVANGKDENDLFLYQRIRRVKIVRLSEIFVEVFFSVAIGVVASQIAVALDKAEIEEAKWTWMTSFYWAIQTTTTIGYGDLTQPYGLRWFKIFYLLFSTYVVGSSLGRLGRLKEELSELRREHAWSRRPVTRRFVDELQAYEHDDKVDQYEFLVASLLMLGKIDSDDIRPVMNKFRSLAGAKGFISVDIDIVEENIEDADTEEMEEDEIDQEEEY